MLDGSVELVWEHPENDETIPLRYYVVQKLKSGTTEWETVHESIQPDVLKCNVRKLKEGETYSFRVIAQYDLGSSEPVEINEPVLISFAYEKAYIGSPDVTKWDGREVTGLAVLQSKIYVLCQEQKTIYVFVGQNPFSCLKEDSIEIGGISLPSDLTSVESIPALYVCDSDKESGCIWKLQMTSPHSSPKRWKITGTPYRLSNTSDDHLLVIVGTELGADGIRYYLCIFNTIDEKELLRISLPKYIEKPLNAVLSNDDQFIVMYKTTCGDFYIIEEINRSGRTVGKHELRGLHGNFRPDSLALAENNQFFVADYQCCSVLIFNSSWTEHEILLSQEDGIDGPSRLCYLKHKQRLIVGQFRTPFVLIFRCCSANAETKTLLKRNSSYTESRKSKSKSTPGTAEVIQIVRCFLCTYRLFSFYFCYCGNRNTVEMKQYDGIEEIASKHTQNSRSDSIVRFSLYRSFY